MNAIASSWPVLFISALVYHTVKLMTFQHDGAKLPSPRGGVTVLLIVLTYAAVVLPEAISGTGNAGSDFVLMSANIGILVFLLHKMRRLAAFSGMLLILLGTHAVELVLKFASGAELGSGLMLLIIVWNVAAMTTLLQRTPKKDF